MEKIFVMRESYLYPDISIDRFIQTSGKEALEFIFLVKKWLDLFFSDYFEQKIIEAGKISPEAVVLVEELRRFINAGGKRVRPAFAYAGYISAGGMSHSAIIYASAALELTHAFALIHDDIMDHSSLRRGKPTVHKTFESYHAVRRFTGDSKDFGESVAILAGDLALSFADEVLNTAPFPAERIKRAKFFFDEMKKQVVFGQYLDITAGVKKTISEEDLLKILEYKTAKYTVERPLHIGAVLAGGETAVLDDLSKYAVPLGQAFQIQDDIIGTFGKESQIGKPTDSDIKEGKKTILVLKALEKATKKQKQRLESTLGNKEASSEEIEEVREILIQTGALDYARKLSRILIERAKQAVFSAKITSEGRGFLLQAADYLLSRQL